MSVSDITVTSEFGFSSFVCSHNDQPCAVDDTMPNTNQKQQYLSILEEAMDRQKRYRYVEWLCNGDIDLEAMLAHRKIEREISEVKSKRYLFGKRVPYRAGAAIAEMKRDLDDSEGC